LLITQFGPEMWNLYQAGLLSNETVLTGQFERSQASVDMQAVLREIDDARAEEAARRLRMGGQIQQPVQSRPAATADR
jgi:RIO kinase 1